MDVGRSPAVDAIPKRIRAWFDRSEEVIPPFVGQHSAATTEIGIDRRDISVATMTVAAAGIGLPHFAEGIGYRLAVAIEHVALDDSLFANRFTLFGTVEDEVIIERTELVRRKNRTGHLRQRVLQGPKRDARRAQHACLVNGRISRGMKIAIMLVKLGFGSHADVTSYFLIATENLLPPLVGFLKGAAALIQRRRVAPIN